MCYISTYFWANIPELVLPNSLVSLDGNASGYLMPFIEDNINLAILLNNPKINLKVKLNFLGKILNLLIKIREIYSLQGKFFLGDIHEGNFIFDLNEQAIKAVDLDSAYFKGGPIPISKFTTFNKKLYDNYPKYQKDEITSRIIPNENTTSLSFLYMLLNILSEDQAYRWSLNEFYQYISYLEKQNFPKDLLTILANIYTPGSIDIYDPSLLEGINTSKNYTLKRARLQKSDGGYYN